MNLQILISSVNMVFAKFLYRRHPEMGPFQFLFMRSLVATLVALFMVNNQFMYVLKEP